MPKKQYTSLPSGYAVCQHSDCKMASTCLHQLAYDQLMQKETYLRLLNPGKCSKDEQCEFYRDNKPVVYARGFTNFQKQMFPHQYREFMSRCISHWSRNTYFERRRGDYPLPPSEQEFILQALKDCGVAEQFEFDSYEQLTNWYD